MKRKKAWETEEKDFLKKIRSGHPRERERWLGVYWLYKGESIAEVGRRLNRSWGTIQSWKKNFEEKGKEGLNYTRSGGRERSLSQEEEDKLVGIVLKKSPTESGLTGNNWDTKKMSLYCKKEFGKEVTHELCRRLMHEKKVTYKKSKKNWQKQTKASE